MSRNPDQICSDMKLLRREIAEDMDDVAESTRELTDWKVYVKRYPWVCIGAAALVGFVAVPKRVEIQSPDVATLQKLAKKNQLVVNQDAKAQAKTGLSGTVLTLLANAAIRGAIAYAGQNLGSFLQQNGSEVSPNDASPSDVMQ